MDHATRILLLLSFVTIAGVVHVVARPREGRLFLVRLDAARAAREASRRVTVVNAVSVIAAAGILFGAPDPTAWPLGLALVLALLVPLLWLATELWLALRSAAPTSEVSRFVVPLDAPRSTPAPRTAALTSVNAVVVLLPVLAMLVANDGDLGPWRFFVPMLVLLNVFIALAKHLQLAERTALPATNTERYAEGLEERRRLVVHVLETARLGWNLTGGLVWACVAFGTTGPAGSIAILAIAVGGPGVVLMFARQLPRLTALADELASLAGADALGTRREGWRWGGLVYFAPQDPALAVPRRSGLGQTLNFGRPAAWAVVSVALLAPPLTVLALM